MRILIAPDKFKDCLTAPAVAEAIAAGLRRVDPSVDLDLCPLADGGEGTVDALVKATGGRLIAARVTGPLPHMKVDAIFGLLGDQQTAVIEMAAASGLMLLKPEDRNPLYTTTFGTGELLLAAAGLGVKQIILGIGGSATNDAGLGAAQAAGLTILLDDGEPVSMTEPLCGQDIDRVILVKRDRSGPRLWATERRKPRCRPTTRSIAPTTRHAPRQAQRGQHPRRGGGRWIGLRHDGVFRGNPPPRDRDRDGGRPFARTAQGRGPLHHRRRAAGCLELAWEDTHRRGKTV
jgi:hypothetical protein